MGKLKYGEHASDTTYYRYLIPYLFIVPGLMMVPILFLRTIQDKFLVKILNDLDVSMEKMDPSRMLATYFNRNVKQQKVQVILYHVLEFAHTAIAGGLLMAICFYFHLMPWTLIVADGDKIFPTMISCRMGKMSVHGTNHIDSETTRCLLPLNGHAWLVFVASAIWLEFVVLTGCLNLLYRLCHLCHRFRQCNLEIVSGNLNTTDDLDVIVKKLDYSDFFVLLSICDKIPSHCVQDLLGKVRQDLFPKLEKSA